MKKAVFSVYDNKAAVYSNPFYAVNVAVASRDFAQACNDRNSGLAIHPDDYSLYQVAVFDDDSGLFTPTIPPLFICSAASCINPTTSGE